MQSVFRSADDRNQIAQRLLTWLTDNLSFFDPPQEDLLFDQLPEQIEGGRVRKAFGELGVALRIVQRVPQLRAMNDAVRLRSFWLEKVKQRNIFFDARRRVQLFPLLAVALAVLEDLGDEPVEAKRVLQNVLDRGMLDRIERSPWHKLDLKYYFDVARLRYRMPDDAALYAQSSLRHPPSLSYASTMDLYGITHLIFHFSDFGRSDLARLAGEQLDATRDYVSLALRVCLFERDFDLSAELLMNLICLRSHDRDLHWAVTDELRKIQQPGGFIPDRMWLNEAQAEGKRPSREDEFFAVYHPTLVMLLLVACDIDTSSQAAVGHG